MKSKHTWAFRAHFRSKAYGWRGTALASKRLREAVTEIKKVAKKDPVTAGEGCVLLMERIWPALEFIDSSSGALGAAVGRTLVALIPVLIEAPCDEKTRAKWLERLFDAVCADGVEYLAPVEERWGEICGSPGLANDWADRILPEIRMVWGGESPLSHMHGDTLCLSCLLETGRYAELHEVLNLRHFPLWPHHIFWARALVRQGKIDEAIAYAESLIDGRQEQPGIVPFCEQVLIDAGREEEAYQKYGLKAVYASTYLNVYRKTAARYPGKEKKQLLIDLIEARGDLGKWFAAAKEARCFGIALACANTGDTEPKTLIRAARDFAQQEPAFAAAIALQAIRVLLRGGGYEPTTLDMKAAAEALFEAATACGQIPWAVDQVEQLIREAGARADTFMKAMLELQINMQRP